MSALESFTSGQPRVVDFTAIERELAGLWKEASVSPEGVAGGRPAVTRACQLNLLALCSAGDEAARATSIVAQVTRAHPSRVVMAVVDSGDRDERLEAFISAHCSFVPGAGAGRQVCCEQITITAAGGAARLLPGAVLPLLLADLPVVLWCPGSRDLEEEVAARLVSASDRLVLDTRRYAEAGEAYPRLISIRRPVTDLAWLRLRGWRELTAALFDSAACDSQPGRLESVEVEHGGPEGSSAEAMLLACWAASRLQWTPAPPSKSAGQPGARAGQSGAAAGERAFALRRLDGRPARLALKARPDEVPPAEILKLTLRSEEAAFTLSRGGGEQCVTVEVTVSGACPVPRVARVVARDEATLLSRALESGGRDPIYDETLRMAARLTGPEVKEVTS